VWCGMSAASITVRRGISESPYFECWQSPDQHTGKNNDGAGGVKAPSPASLAEICDWHPSRPPEAHKGAVPPDDPRIGPAITQEEPHPYGMRLC
jgi:hypothetical protein